MAANPNDLKPKFIPPNKKNKRPVPKTPGFFNNVQVWIVIILLFVLFRLSIGPIIDSVEQLTYGSFCTMLKDNPKTNQIKSAGLIENTVQGELSNGKKFRVIIPPQDQGVWQLLRDNVPNFEVKQINPVLAFLASPSFFILFAIFMLWIFLFRGIQSGGGKILSFGKSKAKLSLDPKTRVTFSDVAGVDEAKEELQEIIEFLKDPKKFQKLGGRIPKGVLLMGPTGTGKTLLAKAVAGEAGVPFFSMSGSDFVEMFVGVGASRVRDLFEQAKKSAKQSNKGCIIFIDEIDAVGRQRFAGIGGGHDEREQTLNALLVEMDGFDTQEGVILLASTNRPDVLDPALLRPGRFDRQVVVGIPDLVGREAILKVHMRNIKVNPGINLKDIAKQTPGFSGADLANLANEAALLAARRDLNEVTMNEMQEAMERVIAGPQKKSKIINSKEKKITACHESGHAFVSLILPDADQLHKVSIIPRGISALGYTINLPTEDRHIFSKEQLMSFITVALAGRVAEELFFNIQTTGAQDDFKKATQIARRMVCEFGMSKDLGNLTFGHRQEQVFLGRDWADEQRNYSEQTAILIDKEIKAIIDQSHKKAFDILTENRDKLQLLADRLFEKEVLEAEEVRQLVGLPLLNKNS